MLSLASARRDWSRVFLLVTTESVKNKQYAVDAVRLLRLDPALAGDKMLLWQRVLGKRTIVHNDQMDMVTSLWERGLLT